ncbi:hypothetical protein ASD54_25345 [Rhizobium sp. Root149]|uniref:hypothetical protein n=1 Tax=Rhizobium sp. Root149 TaxID=1736473 RepID=UPI000714F101|nr:hypothetical protein [Rhizobium sp. Root149]KQZ56270.1 hypothetical protein ASD54_25345 [Rhizobium sp. Root149]
MNNKLSMPIILCLLSSCTSYPKLPEEGPSSILALADAVECEISNTFRSLEPEQKKKFRNWAVTYSITHNATESNKASLDPISWLTPAPVDKFLLSPRAGLESERYRNGKVEFNTKVFNTKTQACERTNKNKSFKVDPEGFLLTDWIQQVAASPNAVGSIAYAVRVRVTTNIGLGSNFQNGRWDNTGDLGHTRVTEETVDFALSDATPSGPTKVVIVGGLPALSQPKPQPGTKPFMEIVPDNKFAIPGQPVQPSSKAPTQTQIPSATVPEETIRRNRSTIQGLQLDRAFPEGLR